MNLEKLRELHERATPGPWAWVESRQSYHVLAGPLKDKEFPLIDENMVLTDGSAAGEYLPDIDVEGPAAQLIVAMRNNIDKLLAVVEAAKGHVDGLINGDLDNSRKHLAAIIDALAALEKGE